ncbi:putative amino acid permease [Trypanosoma conorhini]|uniref:Putative amino acid permease n=1 Tax=Trypanosoma conorhini TaxID=83891 RepID=A0A422N7C2_9TRYP|nr:putative amino acid permease [Trypanosoma conorhini]RNF01363.1 putative amino acid permease [Trypanosoma conorhini]
MTDDQASIPLSFASARELTSGLQGFEVRQRPYQTATLRGGVLRHAWELAPRGAVFYLKRSFGEPREVPLLSLGRGTSDPPQGETSVDGSTNVAGDPLEVPGVTQPTLGQLRATAIAGNDITSSCLYTTGIVVSAAGRFSCFSSLLVSIVLYLFRGVYAEVFSALPMNGGTYNAMLNTIDKNWASLAAILSTLSYIATAVTSAASAGDYLAFQWSAIPSKWSSLGVLAFFAILTLLGMRESSYVATGVFIIHMATLFTILISSLVYVAKDHGQVLRNSWNSPSPVANPYDNWAGCIFFGYSSALLGVSGFETSSNYIEDQLPGVYPKTLRNMWLVVTLVNPALSILAIGVVPIEKLVQNSTFSLALLAQTTVGEWLKLVVVVDAALVLSGAVLTAYIGIQGLHRQLALDRVIPAFFLSVNRWRGTPHFIIIGFALISCSLRLLVNDMSTLGGVYAVAFLCVLMLLCLGSFFLKYRRGKLPRKPIISPILVLLALLLVVAGLAGSIVRAPQNALYFAIYFVVLLSIVVVTRMRVSLFRLLYDLVPGRYPRVKQRMSSIVASLRRFPVVYFAKQPEIDVLNKVIQYIIDNEDTHTVRVIHMLDASYSRDSSTVFMSTCPDEYVHNKEEEVKAGNNLALKNKAEQTAMQEMETCCAIIDQLYPKLTIELLFVLAPFTPRAVYEVSAELQVPRNFMFMGCPGDRFPHSLVQFGGLRVITY